MSGASTPPAEPATDTATPAAATAAGTVAGTVADTVADTPQAPPERSWPLWEVFVRGKRGLSHVHAGSLHAPDALFALRNARDVYTRRQEGVSIWVVRADDITASSPDEKDSFFDPAADKIYRHPTFYDVPDDVEYL
ncbi:ring-1,2-phenylacetyl-CoA epoxidase subunit PaaB [Humibacillus xanthopallidus]|uniref:Ring-1,2-phenylacetyl-CoA epoxidase subunit PaaB n=1 Tax=Humibacillus xanthopallidus TaxID=412689 RepID=A0A543HWH0_9MICO|nr:ring-1,2-phenylacetyl-CoA epoxidase subunit PaaB [Humibacillus xanthopallidus]